MMHFYVLLGSWARGLLRHRALLALITLSTYCAQERHAKVEASGSKAGTDKCGSLVNARSVCFTFDCLLSSFLGLKHFGTACFRLIDACDSFRA